MKTRPWIWLLTALLLAACGSVEIPRENWWRLSLPQPAGGQLPQAGVRRVADLQLGNALSGDFLVVANGPVQVIPRDLDHWIAPLDRLVTDAVVLGLSRTRMFALVKVAGDPGSQDMTLNGRIVEFAECHDGDRATGRCVVAFWIEQDGQVVLREELSAEVAMGKPGAAAAVDALSQALQEVLEELVGRMQQAGLLGAGISAEPQK